MRRALWSTTLTTTWIRSKCGTTAFHTVLISAISLATLLKAKAAVRDDEEYGKLELCGSDVEGNDIEDLPTVVYYLNASSLACEMWYVK